MRRARLLLTVLIALHGTSFGATRPAQDLGIFFAGSEVQYHELDLVGSRPVYETGLSYGRSAKYFRGSISAGIGRHKSENTYSAGISLGPKASVVSGVLDIGIGMGFGYFGYAAERTTSAGLGRLSLSRQYMHTYPAHVGVEGALLDRIDLSLHQYLNADAQWRFKLGMRLFRF